ncbi:MAG TPA: GNAT family N-acetyltransferase [Pseudonocardia sp.]|nr:GNAT family N-acetyltransferase [Pseudonocardia sp.]
MGLVQVRAGTRSDLAGAVDVLGRAFQVEPVYEWLWPDPAQRRRRLPVLLRANLIHLHRGPASFDVATMEGRIVGVSIWDGPTHRNAGRLRRALAWPGRARATSGRLDRLTRVSAALAAVRPVEPHWYLDHVGADPDVPRCGAGSALLAAGLARAEGARVGTHLECKAANVDYYRRFGFEVRDEVVVVSGRLTVLTMWRGDPGSPA